MPDTQQNRPTVRTKDKERHVVVSVRFPERLLQKVNAFAAVKDATANAVIREAVEEHIRTQVRTPEFQEASRAHIQRAQEQVAAVLDDEEAAAIAS
ncbi:hypothetical protein AB0F96_12340 [Streptomyces sp. NPDC023998]|uniref:hypothetical protein n=1 Tax=Streptomyces sp. NPDC023998 TaxID=3154597 RepID=UPI00340FDF4B